MTEVLVLSREISKSASTQYWTVLADFKPWTVQVSIRDQHGYDNIKCEY